MDFVGRMSAAPYGNLHKLGRITASTPYPACMISARTQPDNALNQPQRDTLRPPA